MEEDLSKKLGNIENNIKTYKINQMTQNDSHKIYVYRSQNLSFAGKYDSRNYVGRFIPKIQDKNNIICQFSTVDLGNVQMLTYVFVQPRDPFTARFTVYGYGSSDPVDLRKAYLTCYATCEGEFVVTQE